MAPPRRRPAQKKSGSMTPTQRVQAGKSALPDRFKQTQGQPGGMRSVPSSGKKASFQKAIRDRFFEGRPDVSDDRLNRTIRRETLLNQFKQSLVDKGRVLRDSKGNPVMNTNTGEPVYLSETPGGRDVRDVSMDLAYRFGPTPREIGSDIAYGIGKIGSAIGQKFAAGELGIMGIAKGLYEQFTNNAAKAKDALVKGFDKLTSVEQEILKDPNKYPKMSSHPRVQGIKDIEEYQMSELDKANLIKENMERVSTNVLEKDNTVQSAKVFDDSFRRLPGSGYQAGAGLPSLMDSQTNNIQIQGGQTTPITDQEFMKKEQQANEIFNDPFFNQTSNQMSGAPGFEIVSDYKSPEARMQELIEQNKVNNTNMFDLGINNAKNQLSELERVFGVDMR